ncbi:MAG: secretin N-terminal domain-containing protein [Campylobacterota bacterium]|nr:secretin N-terminal domain-containing protein [Campylobacterota bacterium]
MRSIKILFTLLLLSSQLLMAREQVNVNFSNLQITDFIKLIARISDKNILVNHKINGTVNLVTSAPVYDDEVMGILISVLEAKGFTLVQNGSVYEVVRSAEAAKHNVRVVRAGVKASGSMMVTQAVAVKGENVDVVAAKVRYLISKTAKLMTMKESNILLITDYPKNIETIKRVIGDIDRENKVAMKVIPIKYAKIKEIHTQIAEIAKSLFNEKVESDKVKILLNTDVNGLVLVGKQKNIERLTKTIAKLDREQNLNEEVQIFNLKNSDAKNVLASLKEIVDKQTFSDPTMKPNISASEEINAVIVVGHPMVIKGLKRIINELDKEKYQVYVQARIVEINKDNSEQLGLKYGLDGGIANSSGLYTLAGNFGGSSIAPMNPLILEKLGDSLGDLDSALAIGATLDFLQTNGASQTVSNPSILCVNNQESSIYVGKTLSFQTGEATNSAGGTTNSYQRVDVGLTLKIKPRVSSLDKVTLDVEATLENVIAVDPNSKQPITTKQTVTTQAILGHGENVIIGGLVKTYDTDVETKVPLLGDIPLLGLLFTHNDIKEQQDNLLVILTPYVIAKSEKLSELQEQLGELGRIQKQYNELIFPIVEGKATHENPRPNDPFEGMDDESDY